MEKTFKNRTEAAKELCKKLEDLKNLHPLVLAVPRGAAPMAKIIAEEIQGELDVILVKKVVHPLYPELALGSVTEDGEFHLGAAADSMGFSEDDLVDKAQETIHSLKLKRALYTSGRPPLKVEGRVVIIVDDGIATGATMLAAVKSMQEQKAARIILASPVASKEAIHSFNEMGIESRILYVPEYFGAVSYYYDDFEQVSDAEVGAFFSVLKRDVEIKNVQFHFKATLGLPQHPLGVVIFAQAFWNDRISPGNEFVADLFNRHGISTVLVDLLSDEEARERLNVFDVYLLSKRLNLVTDWVSSQAEFKNLPLAFFGSSTGAGAALVASILASQTIAANVCMSGRTDLASRFVQQVRTPTQFIIGNDDIDNLEINRKVFSELHCEKSMEIIPDSHHLFEDLPILEQVGIYAVNWLKKHFEHIHFKEQGDVHAQP